MGARNQVGIGLSYRPTSLCSLATQFQTRFLELIPCPIAGLKFPILISFLLWFQLDYVWRLPFCLINENRPNPPPPPEALAAPLVLD
jgi:hypothetical protein